MNPTPGRQPTLAQALSALRDDLAAQPMPRASVLAVAQRAARQARAVGPAEGSSAKDLAPAAPPLAWRWPVRRAGVHGAGAHRDAGAPAAWGRWGGAATCAVVLGLSILLALRPPQTQQLPPTPQAPQEREAVVLPGAAGTAQLAAGSQAELVPAMHFVPLVSAERMSALTAASGPSGAEARAWVVTTELAQERLAAMGLPYDPGHAAERLRAELLIAGSGEVLAVRLLF